MTAAPIASGSPTPMSPLLPANAMKSFSPALNPLPLAPHTQLPWRSSMPSSPPAVSIAARRRSPSSKKSTKSSAKASAGTPSDLFSHVVQQTFLPSITRELLESVLHWHSGSLELLPVRASHSSATFVSRTDSRSRLSYLATCDRHLDRTRTRKCFAANQSAR